MREFLKNEVWDAFPDWVISRAGHAAERVHFLAQRALTAGAHIGIVAHRLTCLQSRADSKCKVRRQSVMRLTPTVFTGSWRFLGLSPDAASFGVQAADFLLRLFGALAHSLAGHRFILAAKNRRSP